MKLLKLLLDKEPAEGNGDKPAEETSQPAVTGEPPITAKILEKGKTERELLLERQNARLVKVARKISDDKIELEKKAAHVIRENEVLKAGQQQQAKKEKLSWMGFTS